ncbi:MAG: hypothetical protein LBD02_00455 [Christensenellaceae bacterium]|jgi:hypothetical protein|nr:hypothetical protein [Christensenellaceae bacterium]
MKKFVFAVFFALLLLALCACRAAPAIPAASPSPAAAEAPSAAPTTVAPEESAENATPTPQISETLPEEKPLTVTREGNVEELPSRLFRSEKGYAIYVFSDFSFKADAVEGGDLISPTEESGMDPSIRMLILNATGNATPSAPSGLDPAGTIVWKNIAVGEKNFDAWMLYPAEAAEGGTVLLEAMLDSMLPLN